VLSFARTCSTLALVVSAVAGCTCGAEPSAPSPPATTSTTVATDGIPPEGVTFERVRATIAPSGAARRHPITVARFDLDRFEPVLFTARDDGGARTLDRWVREEHLVAAINAAMYEPDGRPSGFCMHRGVEQSPDDARFGGFYGLDPTSAEGAPFPMVGRDCAGFDLAALRAAYGSLVATYRLLDCDGQPIAWVDPDRYSAAAIGLDAEGRLVFVHARTPYRMRELAEMVAAPEIGLTQAFFVEGGPEATLIVEADELHVREVGLPRDRLEGDEPREDRLYELPNVLGLRPRTP